MSTRASDDMQKDAECSSRALVERFQLGARNQDFAQSFAWLEQATSDEPSNALFRTGKEICRLLYREEARRSARTLSLAGLVDMVVAEHTHTTPDFMLPSRLFSAFGTRIVLN